MKDCRISETSALQEKTNSVCRTNHVVLNKKVIAILVAVVLLTFSVITLAEIDFVRWFTCTGPFAPSLLLPLQISFRVFVVRLKTRPKLFSNNLFLRDFL